MQKDTKNTLFEIILRLGAHKQYQYYYRILLRNRVTHR